MSDTKGNIYNSMNHLVFERTGFFDSAAKFNAYPSEAMPPLICFTTQSCPLSSTAITYTPNYKKTPPPVPPRTTSKPLISITAQSSTESTQDAYHEARLPRGGLWAPDELALGLGLGLSLGSGSGRVLYNSTDSLDSTKAVTIAMEAAGVMAGKRHPSTDSHSSVLTCDKAILVSKAEEYLKTPRSSIGIQVGVVWWGIGVRGGSGALEERGQMSREPFSSAPAGSQK